jgi:radical SAM superfamily enzyme YgiQ (UPF0313 family)
VWTLLRSRPPCLCNLITVERAVKWITQRFRGATLVLGGQFSNLKYRAVLESCPQVDYVVRGDGETAFPALLTALREGHSVDTVPNLVYRGRSGAIEANTLVNYDFRGGPAPEFAGNVNQVP